MQGSIKKIDGAYPVTVADAVYISPTATMKDVFPILGKRWVAMGDSITDGNAGTPYPTIIGEKWGMTVNNIASSGKWLSTYNGMEGIPINCGETDYITFWGGINDFKGSDAVPLGTMEDAPARDTTFYGALHYICRTLIAAHPKAKIGFITPMRCVFKEFDEENQTNANGNTLDQFADAMIEVCGYYGIPVLDMFRENNMSPYISAINSRYYADGLHPNSEGYVRLSNRIERFMMGL